jgi:hypothetical protein
MNMQSVQTIQSASQPARPNLLRNTLLANALFSTANAFVLVFFAQPLATFLGFDAPIIPIVLGVGLLPFAAMLFWMVRQSQFDRAQVQTIITLDLLWVAGSVILLTTGWAPLTTGGKWAVALVADEVALFAILQYVGLRQLIRASEI